MRWGKKRLKKMKKSKKLLGKATKNVPKKVLKEMILEKISTSYKRPTFNDVLAEIVLAVSKRSVCLFYSIGTVIFRDKQVLSLGYNGPSRGDVHCHKVGCSRIVGGKLKKGAGMCRGSHAELNAIGNAANNGINISGASMIISFSPCKSCAKQIVNQNIKEIYYLSEYNLDKDVEKYLTRLGVKLIHYKIKK